MVFSGLPASSPQCPPPARRCFFVLLVSVLGVCVSVSYHFTPGIPFDRNLFAALGMIPGAILCALLLLRPCGGWLSWFWNILYCAILAPAACCSKGMDMGIFPAIIWGALLGASVWHPLYAFFDSLKASVEKDARKNGSSPAAGATGLAKKSGKPR